MSLKGRFRALQLQQLNQVQVASPCPANWDEMAGDEKVRFCAGCRRHVFNLSAMDVEEAAERLAEHADGLCVRFYRRADGTLLTQDCPVGVETRRRYRRATAQLIAGTVAGVTLATAGLTALMAPMATMGAVARPITPELAMRNAILREDIERLKELLRADVGRGSEAAVKDDSLVLLAVEMENPAAVRVLLRFGANAAARDAQGRTALSFARESGNREIIALLRKAGASD